MNKISNQPAKGTMDWIPEEFIIRNYIFETWRKVCLRFGYKEYLTPIVESADIYRAKSGDEVGGKELMSFTDRGNRELAIRPEMTPSVTRMVSKFYDAEPKPIRLFSIANFFRNEKPQRGRNREFWQLNADIFGSESINADIEILQLAIEILLAFGANKDMFTVKINNRNVIKQLLVSYFGIDTNQIATAIRVLDKFSKISLTEFIQQMSLIGLNAYTTDSFWNEFSGFMNGSEIERNSIMEKYIKGSSSSDDFEKILKNIKERNLDKYIVWDPSLARGLDYYDGMVFEVFDKNPENKRAMFGGGRYNGLASIFGGTSFPAVGFAPGDETTKLFLQSWNLINEEKIKSKNKRVFLPLLDEVLQKGVNAIAKNLRSQNYDVESGLEVQKMSKALDYANKSRFDFVVIFNTDEKEQGIYLMKNMITGEQSSFKVL